MGEIITLLTTAAKMAGISPALLIAVCMTETNLKNVHKDKDGRTASYGVCQVKLETAHFMGKFHSRLKMKSFTDKDMKEVEKNVRVAAFYLRYQIERYDGDLCKAVAAYNAGSFKESKLYPGVPFNWKYVERVRQNISSKEFANDVGCKSSSSMVASE